MDPQNSVVVHQHQPGPGSVQARIEKGQRGTYAWELSIEVPMANGLSAGEAFDRARDALAAADVAMARIFGQQSDAIRPAEQAA